MGLFLVWCHRLICIVLSLCKHACKEVCDVNPGIDPYPLLARLCNRWWPDFITFTACKKSRFGLKKGKKAQCVLNRCKDLFERKKYFGVRCILMPGFINAWTCVVVHRLVNGLSLKNGGWLNEDLNRNKIFSQDWGIVWNIWITIIHTKWFFPSHVQKRKHHSAQETVTKCGRSFRSNKAIQQKWRTQV